ncbi:MAG: hypothetical protein US53_C0012G0005 [Candidatus Woesebacteria bacterium GW2011_GWA1_37_7]|uniref:Uncharacterized protein n=1 Tax=Candidatus Woesebacteria bacterium GW2011_GWA1_37_7 TaxID=1618545 RepID=A0A0G0HGN9_9BACT|nr:MAG: hypothetical protein US53_C0012G0005 [Candidatus Woesebacteria bacterium GW2011_GWA1_37_7]
MSYAARRRAHLIRTSRTWLGLSRDQRDFMRDMGYGPDRTSSGPSIIPRLNELTEPEAVEITIKIGS